MKGDAHSASLGKVGAPVKVASFAAKNKPELVDKARKVFEVLRKMSCEFDDNGNVGSRYRRQRRNQDALLRDDRLPNTQRWHRHRA